MGNKVKHRTMSQKTINVIAIVLLGVVMVSFIQSVKNVWTSVEIEKETAEKKERYEAISEELADASDYLTEKVRNFIITGDMAFFDAYWKEIHEDKIREKVIEKLSEFDLTKEEIYMLNMAKSNSDLLVYIETRAMRLLIDAMEIKEDTLPSEVKHYVLNVEEKQMNPKEKKEAAIELVFGTSYTNDKKIIMDAIERFRTKMHKRLQQEVDRTRVSTNRSVVIQIFLLIIMTVLFIALIGIFYSLVLFPIREYTKSLKRKGTLEESIFLQPRGSSELQLLAEKFNKLYEEFVQADKSKSEFIANMSHEIRTPLNTMHGYLYLLKDTPLRQKQKKYLEMIEISSKNLLSIINQILDISKLEDKKYEIEKVDFELTHLVKEMEQMFQMQIAKKKLYFHVENQSKADVYLKGDITKIKQIMINLLSNAVKFTKEGGIRLAFELSPQENGEGVILKMIVEDTGIGMKEKHMEKIFEPFVQSDSSVTRKYGGTGLGLAICKVMTELLNGNIHVESVYNKGTKFIVELPVERGDKKQRTGLQNKLSQYVFDFTGKKILLIDDNEINLKMEQKFFEKHAFTVKTAASGKEAIKYSLSEYFDIAFMDIRMEGMDGFEATRIMKRQSINKDLKVIALTADAEQKTIEKAKRAGMHEFATKPLNFQEILLLCLKYLKEEEWNALLEAEDFSYQQMEKSDIKEDGYLNWEKSLLRLDGEKELYEYLLREFVNKHEKEMLQLLKMFEEKDIPVIAKQLHELKGVCGNIGANPLMEAIAALEKQMKNDKKIPVNIEIILETIRNYYIETKGEIEVYLSKNAVKVSEEQKSRRVTEEIIQKMQQYCENADLEGVTLFELHKKALKQVMERESFQQLEQKIECYDLQGAFQILKKVGEENVSCIVSGR